MTFDEAQIEARRYAEIEQVPVHIIMRGFRYQATQNIKKGWRYIATSYPSNTKEQ